MENNFVITCVGPINTLFQKSKLIDLCHDKSGVQTGPFGSLLHKEDYVAEGTPIITVEHLGDNIIVTNSDTPNVSDTDKDRLSKFQLKEGDIVFSRVGSVDRRAYVSNKQNGWLFSGRCLRVRVDKEKICPKYLSYYFGFEGFKQYIRGIAVGATMPSINTKILSEVDVYYPELKQQKIIAEYLSSIDTKINLNIQTNQTLEKMAQTLFKSWFVDFDPVFDNALAKADFKLDILPSEWPEALLQRAKLRLQVLQQNPTLQTELTQNLSVTSNQQQQDQISQTKHTHQHFPSEFEHNEQLGWVPKGWELGQIDTHAHIEMGQSPKGDTYNDNGIGTPLVNGPVEFGPYFTKKSKWTSAPTKLSKKGDLIVCVRGSTTGRLVKSDGEYCLGRGVCSIRGKKYQAFTDQLFKYSIREMLGLTTGSTFPNWSRQTLSQFKSIVPSNRALELFDKIVSAKTQKIESGVIESESLTKLRDTLLPKLISGELQIPGEFKE